MSFSVRLKLTTIFSLLLVLIVGLALFGSSRGTTHALGAPQALILSESVTAGSDNLGDGKSLEQHEAEADGFSVTLLDGKTWGTEPASFFGQFQVVIIGDPNCTGDPSYFQAALNNSSVWEPVVMSSGGNRLIVGTDPEFHYLNGTQGAANLVARGIAFAGAYPGKTGAYVDLSCAYASSNAGTLIPLLDGLSSSGPHQFVAEGTQSSSLQICNGPVALVNQLGPTLTLHDTDLSNWHCSVHEFFTSFPSDYQPLALATDPAAPATYCATDIDVGGQVCGSPYLLFSTTDTAGIWRFPTPPDRKFFDVPVGGSSSFVVKAEGPAGQPAQIVYSKLPPGTTCRAVANPGAPAEVDCTIAPTTTGFTPVAFTATLPDGTTFSRTFTMGAGRYVAMGDSYSSGEGTASYDQHTDTNSNHCHRSSNDLSKASYPPLLVHDSSLTSLVPSTLSFVACSGATINDIYNGRDGEASQMSVLGSDVTLVTLSVGGDDLGFQGVLENCVNEPSHDRTDQQCSGQEDQIHKLMYQGDPSSGLPPLNQRLIALYQAIRHAAPRARILVMGYPHIFPLTGDNSCGFPGFRYMDSNNIDWLNKMTTELEGYLKDAVQASGVAEYVDAYNAMVDSSGVDHSACGNNATWVNELQLFHNPAGPIFCAPPLNLRCYEPESFHPNPSGYVALEGVFAAYLKQNPPGSVIPLGPNQTVTELITVATGPDSLTATTTWPGSDVTTSLVSPSGRVINRSTVAPDVNHQIGPTYESYTISKPEVGTWKVQVVGTDVGRNGEPVRLTVLAIPHRHRPPLASASATPTQGAPPLTVAFSSAGSAALDGTIASYKWDFGDGKSGSGPSPSHTYASVGRYTPQLTVIDASGATTFAATPPILVGPAGSITPGPVDFGNVPIGSTSAPQLFTLTSVGTGSLTIRGLGPGAGSAADIRIFDDHCTGAVLAPGAKCTFSAAMNPQAVGLRMAELLASDNGAPQDSTLLIANGILGAPTPTVTPTTTPVGPPGLPPTGSDPGGSGAFSQSAPIETGNRVWVFTRFLT